MCGVQYAGNVFQTAKNATKGKNDSSFIRFDYTKPGRNQTQDTAYAQIHRMFIHQPYSNGPRRLIVEGNWLQPKGKCKVTRNHVVCFNNDYAFNLSSKFVFLDSCYQKPVAVWPFDPLLKLNPNDARRNYFQVIDLNETEKIDGQ